MMLTGDSWSNTSGLSNTNQNCGASVPDQDSATAVSAFVDVLGEQAIREARVEKIDLLKIDAEKSELQILSGIHTDDWKKIAQIVLEAHSQAEAEQVSTLLRQQGFRLTLEQEDQLANSGVFNIFAVR